MEKVENQENINNFRGGGVIYPRRLVKVFYL